MSGLLETIINQVTSKKKELIEALEKEQRIVSETRKSAPEVPLKYQDGYIDGLGHAIKVINKISV